MDTILLDTTVASLLHPRKRGHLLRIKYETHMAGKMLALSFQSIAELWSWAEERGWGEKQKAALENLLQKFLVIPYDFELAKVWARVNAQCKRKGRRLEAGDAWIVATAVHRQIPLLTHDLDHVGLEVEGLTVISYAEDNQS
jgi:tRNA(fMet)-specific endonuclease VapC